MLNKHGLQNEQRVNLNGPEKTRSRDETLRMLSEILGDLIMQRETQQNHTSSAGDHSAEKDSTRSEGKSVRFNLPSISENQEPPQLDHTKVAGGAKSSKVNEYVMFAGKCEEFYTMLIRLEYAFRTVGSGGPAMEACRDVRKAMGAILEMLCRNAMDLYQGVPLNQQVLMARGSDVPAYPRGVPVAFQSLRMALKKLDASFIDFVDMYFDGKLLSSVDRARSQLSGVVKTLQETHRWKGAPFDSIGFQPSPDAQIYVHDLIPWLSALQDEILPALVTFLETGIPMITTAQQYQTSKYLNMTTIAAFFSGVTATTLQFTYQSSTTTIENAVNGFLFLSLVFSIASAVNSLLAMSWRTSFIRSPEGHLVLVARIWLMKGPMISLIFAGAFYSTGLVLFAFSSNQNIVTEVITTFFSVAHACGLLCLSMAFVYEQWRFKKNAGAIGEHLTKQSLSMATVNGVWRLYAYIMKLSIRRDRGTPPSPVLLVPVLSSEPGQLRTRPLRSYTDAHLQSHRSTEESRGSEQLPLASSVNQTAISYTRFGTNAKNRYVRSATENLERFPLLPTSALWNRDNFPLRRDTMLASPSPFQRREITAPRTSALAPEHYIAESELDSAGSSREEARMTSFHSSPPISSLLRQTASSSNWLSTQSVLPSYTDSLSTAQITTPRLHQPNIEFSPDGNYLLWCCRGKIPYLLDVSDKNATAKIRLPMLSSIVQTVSWSPDGTMIALTLLNEVLLWDLNDMRNRDHFNFHLYRSHEIKRLKWLPNTEGFFISEPSGLILFKFMTRDRLRLHKNFTHGRKEIIDFDISSNGDYLVCLTPSRVSPQLQGGMSNQKSIVVFSLFDYEEKCSMNVPRNAYSITASRKYPSFILGFFGSSPVLYELQKTEVTTVNLTLPEIQLFETQVYKAPKESDLPFRGKACFAGSDEEFVISSTICGQILVWGRGNASIIYASQSRMPFILEPFIAYNCGSNWIGPQVMYACRDDELEPCLWTEDDAGSRLVMKASSCEKGDTKLELSVGSST